MLKISALVGSRQIQSRTREPCRVWEDSGRVLEDPGESGSGSGRVLENLGGVLAASYTRVVEAGESAFPGSRLAQRQERSWGG